MIQIPEDIQQTQALPSMHDPVKPPSPPITAEQRAASFRAVHFWRGKQVEPWTLQRELYWREYRAHVGAPAIGNYQTTGDFLPEALRILWICHLTPDQIKLLRTLPIELATQSCDAWAEANCTLGEEAQKASQIGQAILEAVLLAKTVPIDEGNEYDSLGESPRPLTTPPSSSALHAQQAGQRITSCTTSPFIAASTTSIKSARKTASRRRGR